MGDLLVEMIAAALHGDQVGGSDTEPNTDFDDWAHLYSLAVFHSVEPLTWAGMSESTRSHLPEEIAAKWQNAADLALFRQFTYDAERSSILSDFRRAGLSWLPLKGIVTATYYPQPGLRSMGDQDLVFGFVEYDPSSETSEDSETSGNPGEWRFRGSTEVERAAMEAKAAETATAIMTAHGYTATNVWERELAFAKGGISFELHRCIVVDSEKTEGYYDDSMIRYYRNPWRLAVPDGDPHGDPHGNPDGDDHNIDGDPHAPHAPHAGGFHWRPEDEYVFHVAHMMKHYRSSGFGLRFLADEAVFCRRFGEHTSQPFDWDYIHAQLDELELARFERTVRRLSLALFDHPRDWRRHVDESERRLFEEIVTSGVYGTRRNGLTKRFRRQQEALESTRENQPQSAHERSTTGAESPRLRHMRTGFARTGFMRTGVLYGLRRIYPPRSWVEQPFPRWADARWKRALLPLYRLSRGLRQHPKDLLFELKLMLRK
ncbi:nucleotidyltransferase family protein [Bifidobacterium margollesii]|nr:nucleotidyltransferase family protein [Bifidobacterium margollesii]